MQVASHSTTMPRTAPLGDSWPTVEDNRENFLQEARSGSESLAEVLRYVDEFTAAPITDAARGAQFAQDVNSVIGWAALELADAAAWTTGLGRQTGVDLHVARRNADRAAAAWNDAHPWSDPAVVAQLVTDTEPLMRAALARAESAIARAE